MIMISTKMHGFVGEILSMNIRQMLIVAGYLLFAIGVGGFPVIGANDETFFETRIRPVLVQRCFECHGRDEAKGGLRVDSREALLKGGDSGPALISGNAASSLLVRAIRRSDENLSMPPTAPLSTEVVDDFVQWINSGAAWPAFKPVKSRRVVVKKPVQLLSPNDAGLNTALQLWLKTENQPWKNGQPVTIWEDSSGRGHDLVATAGGRRGGTGEPVTFISRSTISGFPAVRFQSLSGLGGNAATAPNLVGDAEFSLFVIARIQLDPEGQVGLIAGFGDPSAPANPGRARCAVVGLRAGDVSQPVVVGGWGNDAHLPTPAKFERSEGSPHVMVLTKGAGPLANTTRFFVDGQSTDALVGSGESPDLSRRDDLGFFMGHAQSWSKGFDGDVAEVLLYNRKLSDDERNGVEAFLSAKYRIPLATIEHEQLVEGGDPAFSPKHWAFEPLALPVVPATSDPSLSNPIDRFVAAQWAERGLLPVAQADSRTLVRRLYFDLLGLPPTVEQMESAVADLTPWNDDTWMTLIEHLLESPHYGERWGRHWLDVVRYADTAGDNADYPVPEARYYRDYVIDSAADRTCRGWRYLRPFRAARSCPHTSAW